jgi:L-lactate dehydrogenase complex protein LldF
MSRNEFADAARPALEDSQLRANLREATHTIRDKRARVTGELADWEELREAGRRIKERAMRHLDVHLEQLERTVTKAGGSVHWASSAPRQTG